MPEKDAGLINQIVIAITALGGMIIVLYKNIGLAKTVSSQSSSNAEHRAKVDSLISTQDGKIKEISDNVIMLKSNVASEFSEHRNYLSKNYMDAETAMVHFDRLEKARIELSGQVIKKIDGIEKFLTDDRNERLSRQEAQITELTRQLRDKQ